MRIFLPWFFIFLLLAGVGCSLRESVETVLPSDVTGEQEELVFVIDDGVRIPDASNPIVIKVDGQEVTLAYEYRSVQLKGLPMERVRVATAADGLTFGEGEALGPLTQIPPGVQLLDGTWRRYSYHPRSAQLVSERSEDGVVYVSDPGVRYQPTRSASTKPEETFGVYTYFVDAEGGVVMLHNTTNTQGEVVVNRLYAAPDDQGMNFTLTDENILDGTLEYNSFMDPNAILLPDGRVRLVIMHQTQGPKAPLGRQGSIHSYISEDGGKTFSYEGKLFSFEDFVDLDVYSLNDPKIVLLSDGALRIYVAAMVPSETMDNGYGWVIVSATTP